MPAPQLRCRPGDRALVLRSTDAGKVVTCLALLTEIELAALTIGDSNGPVWRIDRECVWNNWDDGVMLPYCPDSALTPIGRGSNLEREADATAAVVAEPTHTHPRSLRDAPLA